MKFYKLRIDTAEGKDVILKFIEKYSSTYLVSFEGQGTDNPHVHLYLEMLSNISSSLRQAIRRKFGAGNGGYSLKELDEQFPVEYLAYCIKDKNYFYSSNFPVSVIDEMKDYDKKVKEEIKHKKLSRRTVLDTIKDECFSDVDPETQLVDGAYLSVQDVVLRVVNYYQTSKKLVRKFAIVSQCQTLCLEYVKGYSYTLYNDILKSI